MVKCAFKECPNSFIKINGAFIHGRWFCSEVCSENDPEVTELKELYAKGIEFNNNEESDEDDELPEDFEI